MLGSYFKSYNWKNLFNNYRLVLIFVIVANSSITSLGQNSSIKETLYEQAYDTLMTLQKAPDQVAFCSNLSLQRENGVFYFESGKIYLCKPVLGQTCAAIFIGDGRFRYHPPNNIEKEQLVRFLEKDSID